MSGFVARQTTAQIQVGPDDALSLIQAASRSDGTIERAGAPKVIIVEDEVLVAWFLESLLLDMKLEVAEIFSTGEAALAAADRHAPDLIMMDINLGAGIDGVETAIRLRQKHPVPIGLFTACQRHSGGSAGPEHPNGWSATSSVIVKPIFVPHRLSGAAGLDPHTF